MIKFTLQQAGEGQIEYNKILERLTRVIGYVLLILTSFSLDQKLALFNLSETQVLYIHISLLCMIGM